MRFAAGSPLRRGVTAVGFDCARYAAIDDAVELECIASHDSSATKVDPRWPWTLHLSSEDRTNIFHTQLTLPRHNRSMAHSRARQHHDEEWVCLYLLLCPCTAIVPR